jgi:hypothetical protein
VQTIREHTAVRLKQIGVPLHPYLPNRDESKLRKGADVARQIIILNALDGLVNDTNHKYLKRWLIDHEIWEQMAPQDQACFKAKIPANISNELSWKVESLFTLAWTCGFVSVLPPPTAQILGEMEKVYDCIPPQVECAGFISKTKVIPIQQILEELDFYYCVHAAMRHIELWDYPEQIKRLNLGNVLERRSALEWIVDPKTPWHEITLDT